MPTSAAETLLQVQGLDAGYGKIGVLHGVDLAIAAGEVVALLGPNGAGKTTLLRAISGLLPATAGAIRFAGRDLRGRSTRDIVQGGLAHVIEGHRVFTQLSVTDNLLLAGFDLGRSERAARVEEALSLFPEIAEKRSDRGGALSGGQQQMLAVAQGLVRAAEAAHARRAVRRTLARARRPCTRGRRAPAAGGHCGAPGRTTGRKGTCGLRPSLRARAGPDRPDGRHPRA